MDILGSLLIILLGTITGTRADVHPIDKYGLKGGAACLAVRENPHQEMAMKWMTDDNVIVVSEEVSPEYKERVDYNSTDHSLCLRKLEQTDTGIYIAYNVEKWKETQMVKYNLMVQEAVSIPVMKVVSLYSNSSTGQCNITVNCSVEDVWALSVCNGRHCTLSQQSLTVVNITISNDNNTIQCTGKNHVSAKTKSQPMKDICIEKDGKASEFPVGIIVVSVTAGLLFISVIVGICVGIRRIKSTRRRARKNKQPLQVNPVSAPQGERPGPQNTGGSDVTTIYVTVVKPGAAGVELPSPEEMSETQSEALYSTVQHPAAEESHLVDKVGATKEDRPGPQSPTETEPTSIYSTVQKPAAAQRCPVDKYGNNLNKPDRAAQ